ncbi:hypothetical protein PoB_003233500 [Plakobranchus ocellatus]|uniref:Uncharacterized protein n=1 Tax=Plakobranchus ocellatus TaxID=259542 RepID=A0AAV4ACE2_9GAST|nr:hypothetical protein PoB_003233500 [Plakobranchus ocellatus]
MLCVGYTETVGNSLKHNHVNKKSKHERGLPVIKKASRSKELLELCKLNALWESYNNSGRTKLYQHGHCSSTKRLEDRGNINA